MLHCINYNNRSIVPNRFTSTSNRESPETRGESIFMVHHRHKFSLRHVLVFDRLTSGSMIAEKIYGPLAPKGPDIYIKASISSAI